MSVYIFTPLYIETLGIDSYGVTAFYATISGVLILFDLGISSSLMRQMASIPLKGTLQGAAEFLRTIEVVYTGVIITIFLLFYSLSGLIASEWLNSNNFSFEERKGFIQLIFISASFQLMASFYQAGLIGQERQVISNLIQFIWAFVRSVGALFIIWWVSPTAKSFLIWQLVCNVLYLLFTRKYLIQSFVREHLIFKISSLKGHYKFASGMMMISILAILNTQIDKIIVSKMFEVGTFALYAVASTVAQAPLVLSNPISNAILPRFTALHASELIEQTKNIFLRMNLVVVLISIPACITLVVFNREILFIWGLDSQVINGVSILSERLLIGSMFLAWQIVPFNYAISMGKTGINVLFSILLLVLNTFFIFLFMNLKGVEGVPLSWMICNVVLTIPYIYVVIQNTLGHTLFIKLMGNNFLILLISVSLLGLSSLIIGDKLNGIALLITLVVINFIVMLSSLRLIFWKKNFKQTILRLFNHE